MSSISEESKPLFSERSFGQKPTRIAMIVWFGMLAIVPFVLEISWLQSFKNTCVQSQQTTLSIAQTAVENNGGSSPSASPISPISTSSPAASPPSDRDLLCSAALKDIERFDDNPDIMGTKYLRDQGVVLAMPNTTVSVNALEDVRVPIYNCGDCRDPKKCRVHVHTRLVGAEAIRSALAHQAEDGDYYVDFKAPPVGGAYELHASPRWWHGDEFPTTYLGGPAKQKARQEPAYVTKEAACVIYGSPQRVEVETVSPPVPSDELRVCKGIEEPGYWEKVDKEKLCGPGSRRKGECFVLDNPNKTWHYRGDDCRPRFPNAKKITKCLRDTSIVVYGDSLSKEFLSNLRLFLPESIQHRITGLGMVPAFGNFSKGEFYTETKRVVFVTDFNIAHIIQNPMYAVTSEAAPMAEYEWSKLLENKPSNVTVEGVFYTGYLPYCERENGVSFERMQEANEILAATSRKIGFKIFNTTAPMISRPDASWDGLHLLIGKKRGPVSKFLSMMLIQDLCGSKSRSSSSKGSSDDDEDEDEEVSDVE